MVKSRIRVGVIGAAGLSAGRLIGYLLQHPAVELVTCISDSSPGKPLHTSHPTLRGMTDMLFDALDTARLSSCDVAFSCKKAGESFGYVPELLANNVRVIDLSGDYRLKTPEAFRHWYGIEHAHPNLLRESVYGLCEWYREEIRGARLVANPGCYTTTAILGCAPMVAAGYGAGQPVLIDAISGVSGAGRAAKAENLFISVSENVRAYRVGNHQHTPEIEQELAAIAAAWSQGRKPTRALQAEPSPLLFVPHVGPYKIGIMADSYVRVADGAPQPDDKSLYDILQAAYKNEPFVRVYEPGTLPQTDWVAGTNFCDIGAKYDERTRTIAVFSVTDNLVKGAAGQAIQNMNIMFGQAETAGLIGG